MQVIVFWPFSRATMAPKAKEAKAKAADADEKKLKNIDADKAEEAKVKLLPEAAALPKTCCERFCCCFAACGRALAKQAQERAMAPMLKEARRQFALIDLDGNGTLSVEELMMLRSKATFGSPEEMLKARDANNNGVVDLEEWLAYFRQEYEKNPAVAAKLLVMFEKMISEKRQMDARTAWASNWELKSEAERVFNVLDEDGSRLLDIEELRALRHTHDELVRIQADRSGHLDLAEFMLYVKTW